MRSYLDLEGKLVIAREAINSNWDRDGVVDGSTFGGELQEEVVDVVIVDKDVIQFDANLPVGVKPDFLPLMG